MTSKSGNAANSARARTMREKALRQSYTLLPGALKSLCFYCGISATGVDHVPALVVVYDLGRSYFEDLGITLWLVPSCAECNGHLAAKPIYSLYLRRKEIAQWLRDKYEKFLAIPRWTDSELDQLGTGLKKQIKAYNEGCEYIKRRIGFAERD